MKVIYFNCTCSHFSHKYRRNAICKRFFSSVLSMTGAKCFVCNLPCRFSASFRSNQAIKIFGSVAEDCVTPIWKSILIYSFKYCTDWSLSSSRRSVCFSVATKYLCYDTKDFFPIISDLILKSLKGCMKIAIKQQKRPSVTVFLIAFELKHGHS